MPPRAKSKIQNQPKKEEMSPVVQQIKSVMTPSVPIEQAVYLNDDKVVTHEEGSNRYWINYLDTESATCSGSESDTKLLG